MFLCFIRFDTKPHDTYRRCTGIVTQVKKVDFPVQRFKDSPFLVQLITL